MYVTLQEPFNYETCHALTPHERNLMNHQFEVV